MRNDRALLGSLFLAALMAMSGCASNKVTRVDTASVTDLSGRWNDTDSRLVAEAMIKEAMSQPWLDSYTRAKGRAPVVIIGTIANRTLEHINVQTFVSDLERELTNSQRVIFVAGRGEREEVREERRDQADNALESTRNSPRKELGADFMLRGTVSAIEDELDGTKAVLYQVDLEMVDLTNNVKAWFGQKKIKKVVDRKRVVF
jgi:uncharacterized protein (TIGR02722 family)